MGFIYIAKLSFAATSPTQAPFLMAGWSFARPESRPLGLPGDLPQGFGGFAGVPSRPKSAETLRCTLTGVRRPGSQRLSHGSLRSATHARAKRRAA
jgi:hypothetical protein